MAAPANLSSFFGFLASGMEESLSDPCLNKPLICLLSHMIFHPEKNTNPQTCTRSSSPIGCSHTLPVTPGLKSSSHEYSAPGQGGWWGGGGELQELAILSSGTSPKQSLSTVVIISHCKNTCRRFTTCIFCL